LKPRLTSGVDLTKMRLLIDEQLLGCGLLLRSIGYDVTLANETGFQRDEDLVEHAIEKGLFVITEDNGMATLCKFRNVPHLHLEVSMKAKLIVEELKKRGIARLKPARGGEEVHA